MTSKIKILTGGASSPVETKKTALCLESAYGWHEGHRGEFEDEGEMESGGSYSRARGYGIRVQERIL